MVRVLIDPGHGGADPGTIREPVMEKSANLVAAFHLYGILRRFRHIQPELTRWDDRTMSLEARTEMANGSLPDSSAYDVFLSLHFNAAASSSIGGSETLYLPGSNKERDLASKIQARLSPALGLRDRGIKPRGDLYVLKHTRCPAVLVEIAFLSNPREMALFDLWGDLDAYKAAAEAVAEGLMAWIYPSPE